MTNATFGFDSEFLRRLERLSVINRRTMRGPAAGPRGSPRHGASVEFADFRNYVSGDFRRVDWRAYGRLDRLFLRLYRAEESITITILIDHSSSMSFGEPSKLLTAARLAAILSYVALHNYDTVAVAGWGDGIDHYLPGQSGKHAVPRVWKSIADVLNSPVEATDFAGLKGYGKYRRGPGIAVVLSDFMTASDWRSGLRSLRAAGQEVTALQILTPEEIEPSLRGDWKLVDAESGAGAEVTISPRLLRRYREALERHTAAVNEFCRREGISFLRLDSDVDLAGKVVNDLRTVGVLG